MSLLGKIGWLRRPLLVVAAAVGLLATASLTAPAKAQWYYPAYAGYCNPWYGCGYAYPYASYAGFYPGWGWRRGFHHGFFHHGFHHAGFHGGLHGGGFGGRHR